MLREVCIWMVRMVYKTYVLSLSEREPNHKLAGSFLCLTAISERLVINPTPSGQF